MICRRNWLKRFVVVVLFSAAVVAFLHYKTVKHVNSNWNTFDWIKNKFMFERTGAISARLTMTAIEETTPRTIIEDALCTESANLSVKALDIVLDVNNTTLDMEGQRFDINPGGRYKPSGCLSKYRVAVLVPYRDRETHLKLFLHHMHPFLQRQQLDYGIFVIESIPGVKFNRALLLNIGFVEASKPYEYDCFIFHDVDLLPENDGIRYTCDRSPEHLSSAIDEKKYKLPYNGYFGGVCAFSKEHFKKINGFSNIYFGWGGEDDDIRDRVKYNRLKLNRLPLKAGRYKMLQHDNSPQNPDKYLLFKTMKTRHLTDGLNSLNYRVLKQENKRLYTWILVSFNETEVLEKEPIHKQAFDVNQTKKKNDT